MLNIIKILKVYLFQVILNKLYNIQEIYKKLFEENTIKNFYDLSNPSSGGNPSSESFSSRFK